MTAWSLVAMGVAAPVARRRARLAPAAVLAAGALAPVAARVAMPRRTRVRDATLCALNMWAYLAAYEMPHDDPERLAARVRVSYPLAVDRFLGLGKIPTLRLQQTFSTPKQVNRFERVLAGCHWIWFAVPHTSLGYILWKDPDRFPAAAGRMYAVFDLGAVFYWAIPTAPPWWAALHGGLRDDELRAVRRMMIEYGPEFWGDLWDPLFKLLGGNPLAAMPSLHFATSLMGAHLLSELGPVPGAVGWTYAILLGLALVYLGEHYAVDLIGGAVLTETIRSQAPRTFGLLRRLQPLLDTLDARTGES